VAAAVLIRGQWRSGFSEVAPTRSDCNIENNALTTPLPHEDVFLVVLQLRECVVHDL